MTVQSNPDPKREHKTLVVVLVVLGACLVLFICGSAWAAYNYISQLEQPIIQGPSNPETLYHEAKNQYELAIHETVDLAYWDEIDKARLAIDLAIALDPTKGDYYYLRYEIYNNYAGFQKLRTDYEYYMAIALENLHMAISLGTSEEYADREIAFTLFYLGRCDEGMEVVRQLNIERGVSAPPSTGLLNAEAHGYLCLGQLDQALEYMDRVLEIEAIPENGWLRAVTLYQLGRSDEALAQLDALILNSPQYFGYRYYLRALIYYEKGMVDQATQDLATGEANTWGKGGLRMYVQGLMALDAGDQSTAIEYLQESLATLPWMFRPTLSERISLLLESLGAEPLPDTLTASIAVTPMPTLQATPAPTLADLGEEPLSGEIPTPPNPLIFDMQTGTGRLTFGETSYYPLILFRPANPVTIQSVHSLTLNLLSNTQQDATNLRAFLWNPATGEWVIFRPNWGANVIGDPARFVDAEGNIYLAVRYRVGWSALIDNIWVTLSATATDGSDIFIDLNK